MKRKILIIASIVGVFIACQDDLLPPEKEEWGVTRWLNGNNQEEIVAAQKWYAEHKNEVTTATRSLGEHPNKKMPSITPLLMCLERLKL